MQWEFGAIAVSRKRAPSSTRRTTFGSLYTKNRGNARRTTWFRLGGVVDNGRQITYS